MDGRDGMSEASVTCEDEVALAGGADQAEAGGGQRRTDSGTADIARYRAPS